MTKKSWILTDVDQDVHVAELAVTPNDLQGVAEGYAVKKRTLRGGLRDGVDVVELDNGAMRIVVIPTRGMGIWRATLGKMTLGWKSPVKGPVNPAFVHQDEASGIGWLDGFDEFMVRCGLENNGGPQFDDKGSLIYPLHGKIANIPAHKVELTVDGKSGEMAVTGTVDEARLFANKLRLVSTVSTKPGQHGFTITDVISNISGEPSELQLLYHTNFGLPLLEPGAKAVLPVAKMAPRDAVGAENASEWNTYGPPTAGLPEAVFFFDLAANADGSTRAVLRNAVGDRGAMLSFNKNQLPCFTLWKNRQAEGDGYVTGLEPAINYPNGRAFEKEKGRVAVLEPGESRTFELTIEALTDAAAVAEAEAAVAKIQAGTTPRILTQPDPDWAPTG